MASRTVRINNLQEVVTRLLMIYQAANCLFDTWIKEAETTTFYVYYVIAYNRLRGDYLFVAEGDEPIILKSIAKKMNISDEAIMTLRHKLISNNWIKQEEGRVIIPRVFLHEMKSGFGVEVNMLVFGSKNSSSSVDIKFEYHGTTGA